MRAIDSPAIPLPADWLDGPIRIALIGVGGTGSHLADALCSLHTTLIALGHPGFEMTLWDGDVIQASNVGRQRFTKADIGQHKSILLAHRLRLFYDVPVTAKPEHYTGRGDTMDLYLTATDSVKLRAEFPRMHPYSRAFWIDVGNGEASGQVIGGHLGDPQRAGYVPHVVDLYPEILDAAFQRSEAAVPTCSTEEAIRAQSWPVNRAAAQHVADFLWQWIRTGRMTHNGVLFTVSPPTVSLIPATPASWAQFGWVAPALKAA